MAQRPRTSLYPEFEDGERPSGADFKDFIDSYINIVDDPISIDSNNDIIFSNGIGIGNTSGDSLGSVRFNGTQFEFRETTGWEKLGSGGAFQEIGGGPDVAFNNGTVGINTGSTPTGFMFHVNIGTNDGPGNLVRFGSAVIHDSSTTAKRAYFSHVDRANNTEFALNQHSNGRVQLNAKADQSIRFTLDGSRTQLAVMADSVNDGFVVVGATSPSVDPNSFPAVKLFVEGDAFKTGANTWETSDIRLKRNITTFEQGLEIIKQINPIQFQYNGKAWTRESESTIGVSGQDIEKIAPFMISKAKVNGESERDDTNEYLVFNSKPLIYLAINAVKELSDRIEKLEKQLSHEQSGNTIDTDA